MTKHYVIWWTNQTDAEMVAALMQEDVRASGDADATAFDWPEYLYEEWASRDGRNGRGRLWNAFPDALPDGVDPWPSERYALLLGGEGRTMSEGDRHSAAGIVIPLEDLHHVIGLPGFVTNDTLCRLCVHGVDLDL